MDLYTNIIFDEISKTEVLKTLFKSKNLISAGDTFYTNKEL